MPSYSCILNSNKDITNRIQKIEDATLNLFNFKFPYHYFLRGTDTDTELMCGYDGEQKKRVVRGENHFNKRLDYPSKGPSLTFSFV